MYVHNNFEKIIASEINFYPTFFTLVTLLTSKGALGRLGKQCGAGKRLTVGPTPSRSVAGLSVGPLSDPRWDRLSRSLVHIWGLRELHCNLRSALSSPPLNTLSRSSSSSNSSKHIAKQLAISSPTLAVNPSIAKISLWSCCFCNFHFEELLATFSKKLRILYSLQDVQHAEPAACKSDPESSGNE
jgi:hypothetical protein